MLGLLMAAALALAADDSEDLTSQGLKRLVGEWQVDDATRDGKQVKDAKKVPWKIRENEIITGKKDKKKKATVEIVTKNVRGSFSGGTIDMVTEDGKTLRGIYWLDKDNLLLNFAAAGAERPKRYVPEKEDKGQFWQLSRMKKKK